MVSIQQPAAERFPLADLLALSDDRDLELRLRLQAHREGFWAGQGAGFAEGYAAAIAELEAAHRAMAQRIQRGEPFPELEARRWAVRGQPRIRATFADPHPDDYPGRRAA